MPYLNPMIASSLKRDFPLLPVVCRIQKENSFHTNGKKGLTGNVTKLDLAAPSNKCQDIAWATFIESNKQVE